MSAEQKETDGLSPKLFPDKNLGQLVLRFRQGETAILDNGETTINIKVVQTGHNKTTISFIAPKTIKILRGAVAAREGI